MFKKPRSSPVPTGPSEPLNVSPPAKFENFKEDTPVKTSPPSYGMPRQALPNPLVLDIFTHTPRSQSGRSPASEGKSPPESMSSDIKCTTPTSASPALLGLDILTHHSNAGSGEGEVPPLAGSVSPPGYLHPDTLEPARLALVPQPQPVPPPVGAGQASSNSTGAGQASSNSTGGMPSPPPGEKQGEE